MKRFLSILITAAILIEPVSAALPIIGYLHPELNVVANSSGNGNVSYNVNCYQPINQAQPPDGSVVDREFNCGNGVSFDNSVSYNALTETGTFNCNYSGSGPYKAFFKETLKTSEGTILYVAVSPKLLIYPNLAGYQSSNPDDDPEAGFDEPEEESSSSGSSNGSSAGGDASSASSGAGSGSSSAGGDASSASSGAGPASSSSGASSASSGGGGSSSGSSGASSGGGSSGGGAATTSSVEDDYYDEPASYEDDEDLLADDEDTSEDFAAEDEPEIQVRYKNIRIFRKGNGQKANAELELIVSKSDIANNGLLSNYVAKVPKKYRKFIKIKKQHIKGLVQKLNTEKQLSNGSSTFVNKSYLRVPILVTPRGMDLLTKQNSAMYLKIIYKSTKVVKKNLQKRGKKAPRKVLKVGLSKSDLSL